MLDPIVARYDRRAPRYTSYPTVPCFTPAVDEGRYRRWLAELDGLEAVSLYLHVPFCSSLCWFCGCNTTATRRDGPVAAYARDLAAEIGLVVEAIGRRLPARWVHWGGGSPTRLSPADFSALMERLRQGFDIAADATIAVEIDPRTLTPDFVRAMRSNGVGRASIGVQDINPDVQRAINRVQSLATTAAAFESLRGVGIDDIGVDLMYGLPHQTADGVAASARAMAALAPNRLSLFGYAHVPRMKRHQRLIDAAALPDAGARLAQFSAARAALEAAGFVAIGLDHFARSDDPLATGPRFRNFQGYTTDSAATLLGFGASAIGTLPQGYVQNDAAVPVWRGAVAAGRLPTARGVALDDGDRLRRAIIERLMCDLEADVATIAQRYGADPGALDPAFEALRPMVADGLVALSGSRVSITERGRPFARVACAAFDARLDDGEAVGSRAV